ncbi:MAG: efflux RND transporter permease subunit, partial [Planctomycetia bacterium]
MIKLLRWAISNSPAMNILMVTVLGLGFLCAINLRRETFPDFDLEFVMVSVPFPGSTPEEVEEAICQKVEEAVRTIEGIKQITSTANEGAGSVLIELRGDVEDIDRTLNEIRSEVDRIPNFPPELAEQPIVQRIAMQETIIYVGVTGPEAKTAADELMLRKLAEQVRDDLTDLPAISQVSLVGSKAYQVDIEIPEETLRSHGLTLSDVAQKIRRENIKQPGGTIRARSQEVNVRTDNRRYIGPEIAKLPVVTEPDGSVLTLADLGYVRDEFADASAQTLIDGRPGQAISVMRNTNEDLLEMVDQVKEYVATTELPEGYKLITWGDRSVEIRSRLELMVQNGLQGLLIVFILLTLFLDVRLAFWVALGIPFAIFATSACLTITGNTLNMMSSFAIIMALGIVVDDAIVVGENIFAH